MSLSYYSKVLQYSKVNMSKRCSKEKEGSSARVRHCKGPTGPTGPSGQTVIGPIGPTGLQGLPGSTGLQGLDGATGPTGLQGIAGPPGENGASIVGPTGPTGPSGSGMGATGPTGLQGPIGPAGLAGVLPNGVTIILVDPNLPPADTRIVSTISEALTIASSNITSLVATAVSIFVAPGIYSEDLVIATRNISIIGLGTQKSVIINGDNSSVMPVVTVNASGLDDGVFNNNIYLQNLGIQANAILKTAILNTSVIPISVHVQNTQVITQNDEARLVESLTLTNFKLYIEESSFSSESSISPSFDLMNLGNATDLVITKSYVAISNTSYAGLGRIITLGSGTTSNINLSTIIGRVMYNNAGTNIITGTSISSFNYTNIVLINGATVTASGLIATISTSSGAGNAIFQFTLPRILNYSFITRINLGSGSVPTLTGGVGVTNSLATS
jgi:hypothetical protein